MRTSRLSQLLTAFVALLGLSALLIIPPALLVLGIGNPVPDWASLRTGHIDDPTLIRILGCVVWVAWAQFTLGTVVEAVAATRRWPMPRRIAIGQGLARALITIIATAVATTPVISAVPLAAAGVPPHGSAPTTDIASRTPHRPDLRVYVVGSEPDLAPSLWTIAERHLGNPLRWKEIWQLNRGSRQPDGRLFNDPQVIRLGWTLRLPADASDLPSGPPGILDVTVARGDTLSGIAERSGLSDWHPIWAVTQGESNPAANGSSTLT
jgi:LysM domain-containing protein